MAGDSCFCLADAERMKQIHGICEISIYKYEWLEIHAFVCLCAFNDLYTLGWYMLVFSEQLEGMG